MNDKNYQEIIEELQLRVELLEKALKSRSKMAKKDYDGDGKLETSEEEYLGSKDKAIKNAMAKKKIEEALDRVGGNFASNSPSIRCLSNNVDKSSPIVENVVNMLSGKKKQVENINALRDSGSKIQLSEKFIFGGFPTLNKEQK